MDFTCSESPTRGDLDHLSVWALEGAAMVEDRRTLGLTESIEEVERLRIEELHGSRLDTTCTLNYGGQVSQLTLAMGLTFTTYGDLLAKSELPRVRAR
jgi:hypothetical protein